GGVSARKRNDADSISTGPPKYNLPSTPPGGSRSGKRPEMPILVGLLMITPMGASPMLFMTSTTESLKLESGSPARATSRIAVRPFASWAAAGKDIPKKKSRKAQKTRVTSGKYSHRRLRECQDRHGSVGLGDMVETKGIEPSTSALRTPRSPS